MRLCVAAAAVGQRHLRKTAIPPSALSDSGITGMISARATARAPLPAPRGAGLLALFTAANLHKKNENAHIPPQKNAATGQKLHHARRHTGTCAPPAAPLRRCRTAAPLFAKKNIGNSVSATEKTATGTRETENGRAKRHPPERLRRQTGLQNGTFGNAKRHISQCETARPGR